MRTLSRHLPPWRRGLLALGLLGCVLWGGYGLRQSHFFSLAGLMGLWWALLWALWRQPAERAAWRWWLGWAWVLRLALLLAPTALSDDVFRFIWDGRLLAAGIHPFAHTPEALMALPQRPAGCDEALFALLNSPRYHSIYPPLAQASFWLAALLAPKGLFWPIVWLRLMLLGGEWLLLRHLARLLARWGWPPERLLLYALHPLVLLEVVANLHYEGLMLGLLLWALWGFERGRDHLGGLALALAVAAKLLPLLYYPALALWGLRQKRWQWWPGHLLALALLFLPLLWTAGQMGSSLDLYFRKFEFNASLYYLARALGEAYWGYNNIRYIGPALGLLAGLGIVALAWRWPLRQVRDWPALLLWSSTLHLLLATTVHPWYLVMPLGLGLLGRWRFVQVWSALAFLSYAHYAPWGAAYGGWAIALEYGVLAWAIWRDLRRR